MLRTVLEIFAVLADHLAYLTALSRLTVLDWLAGPLPERRFLINQAEFERRCAPARLISPPALAEGSSPRGAQRDQDDAHATALAMD